MRRIFGIETEYGITVEGIDDIDVVTESMALIRCYLTCDFVQRWNYNLENPRMDVRGFEVTELLNDKDETLHLQKDRSRQIPLKELKSDLVLTNGARFYNDHTHPEYSTGECSSLQEVVAQDKAGERIIDLCGKTWTENRERGVVKLYKNNTDFDGHSYGCHENYLLRRDVPFERVIDALLPFFVTRQTFAGAGKVGVEGPSRDGHPASIYQLSQRSDFFEVIASVDTMHKRPIINTRDEPHADRTKYRRLHVIIGDANMSEVITALKVGTTLLVLDLLEERDTPPFPKLRDPVRTIREVSRDQTRAWLVELENGSTVPAVDLQRIYLTRAEERYAGRDEETDWTLRTWRRVLDDLETDPTRLMGICDWVTKKWLLDAFVEDQHLSWENGRDLYWLQSQDLEYHNVDRENGLYYLLEGEGQTERLTSDKAIRRAMTEPPGRTRAYLRGQSLARFEEAIISINWDSIVFKLDGGRRVEVDLSQLVEQNRVDDVNRALERASSIEELVGVLQH
ncbi:MAG: proteasome accessory factor PafA2 family protein, partial [Candidatus Latescibacteria bacterium]|nr:proteasome accessory factor PafA2 family protein [Candidatus Latescibacterota bacterium]